MMKRYICLSLLVILAAAFINCENKPMSPEGMLLQEQSVDSIDVTISGKVACASCGNSTMLVDVIDPDNYMSFLDKPYLYDSIGNFKIEVRAPHGARLMVRVTMNTPKGVLVVREESVELPDEGDETSYSLSFQDPQPGK